MPHDLDRFVEAQDAVWPDVLAELTAGAKRSHWMWFVFPQIAGLGRSATSRRFAIADLAEARAYLAHSTLGPRLHAATDIVLRHRGTDPAAIFGAIDAAKFRSCLTLFAAADPAEPRFRTALDAFCGGAPDPRTLALLGPPQP